MAAPDYSGGGENPAADPRQTPSRSRHRRAPSAAGPDPQRALAPGQPARMPPAPGLAPGLAEQHLSMPGGAAALEPPNTSFAEGALPLPGMLPPAHLLGAEGGGGPDDFAWAPQHTRMHSAYAPLAHHRHAPSLYQPPAPAPVHGRDQSASDFYFLQSPHVSPNLSQGPFDPLGLDAGSLLGAGRTPPLPDAPAGVPRPRHARGGSISKQSPTRAHRRTRTLGSQSGRLPFAAAPGFPGPLLAPHAGPGPAAYRGAVSGRPPGRPAGPAGPAGVQMPPGVPSSVPSSVPPGVPSSVPPGVPPTARVHAGTDAADAADAAEPQRLAAPGAIAEPPAAPAPEPAEPAPMLSTTSMRAAYTDFRPEAGSPGPPAWHEPARPSHASDRSTSPDKRHKPRSRRHARRRTRESNLPSRYSPPRASPSVLTATNPMSDYSYSQGLHYHGLGIGLSGGGGGGGGGGPPAAPQQALTPILASPQMGAGFAGPAGPMPTAFPADVNAPPPPPPPPPPLPPGSSSLQQFGYMDRPGLYAETTPMLGSMPFLPPYVSYEQQLQQQREQEQHEPPREHGNEHSPEHHDQQHEPHQLQHQQPHQLRHQQLHEQPPQHHQHQQHQHQQHQHQHQHQQHQRQYSQFQPPPLQSQWRDDEVWQHDYWGAPRYDRPPIAGPSSAPRRAVDPFSSMEPPRAAGPAAWATDLPFAAPAPAPLVNAADFGPGARASSASMSERPSALPSIASLGADAPAGPDELALDVPGPNYDESARMDWSIEDMEELMRLLEPAEKYKWRYMSDLLTETRKKRIPLRTCQNKFHALFGETESSSKLRSSLFYVAYRSGWDSIRESSTMREREAETAQQQAAETRRDDAETASAEAGDVEQRPGASAETASEKTTEGGARTART